MKHTHVLYYTLSIGFLATTSALLCTNPPDKQQKKEPQLSTQLYSIYAAANPRIDQRPNNNRCWQEYERLSTSYLQAQESIGKLKKDIADMQDTIATQKEEIAKLQHTLQTQCPDHLHAKLLAGGLIVGAIGIAMLMRMLSPTALGSA